MATAKSKLRPYNGIRVTSDLADCALPISIDSHSMCSYGCLYCFGNYITSHVRNQKHGLGELPIGAVEKLLAGEPTNLFNREMADIIAAKCPIQMGGLADPFDDIERVHGWAKRAIPLFTKYNHPVRISTKGGRLLQTPEYLRLFAGANIFWFAFSIITEDPWLKELDKRAPSATERFAAMKALSREGHRITLRLRPFIKGISDRFVQGKPAWEILLERGAEAGAEAVSLELMFMEGAPSPVVKKLTKEICALAGNPDLYEEYKRGSSGMQKCLRYNRDYKRDVVMAIRDKTHAMGLRFNISDPHFKELNDTACCCGLPPDDPIFGNWSRHTWTRLLMEGYEAWHKKSVRLQFCPDDWVQPWMRKKRMQGIVFRQAGKDNPLKEDLYKQQTVSDAYTNTWNNPRHPRAPYIYFDGILRPVRLNENNDVVYEYSPEAE